MKTHVAISSSYCERMITKRPWGALSFGGKVGHHGYVDLSSLSLSFSPPSSPAAFYLAAPWGGGSDHQRQRALPTRGELAAYQSPTLPECLHLFSGARESKSGEEYS